MKENMRKTYKFIIAGIIIMAVWIAGMQWGIKVGKGVASLSNTNDIVTLAQHFIKQNTQELSYDKNTASATYGLLLRASKDLPNSNTKTMIGNLKSELGKKIGKNI